MPKILIVLITLFCIQHVKCGSVFEYIYNKLIDLKDAIVGPLKEIRNVILRPINVKYTKPRIVRNSRRFSPVVSSQSEPMYHYVKPGMNLICNWTVHFHTTPQLSAFGGRIMETHVTVTLDGYVLTLHRLHYSTTKEQDNFHQGKRTVLLHHGLLGSSADWILLGPKKSLPFLLSDAGHDVWLANARGNYYSRGHVSESVNSEKYWNFSWQEIGEYDLPATLDYIRKINNSTKPIDFVGHSLGATALLVLLSTKCNYNSYFRIAVFLAPLAFMANTRGALHKMTTVDKTKLMSILGTKEFLPTRRTPVSLSRDMCQGLKGFCHNPLFFLTGSPLQNSTRATEFMKKLQLYSPAGGSTKTIKHYMELISNRQFHRYGNPNLKFDLKLVKSPIFIMSSNDDSISNTVDNQVLSQAISNPIGHVVIKDQNLSHTEFVWGLNAEVLIYNKIKDFIDAEPDSNEIHR